MGADYDEFAYLEDNAADAGLPWTGPPRVERRAVTVGPGRELSALVWDGDPELVLLHGGAQNAHTWDTVALALGRPLVAIDLPGHGHSSWRDSRDYRPAAIATDVATAIDALAPRPRMVVGMSHGGLTTLALASVRPALVPRAVLVDVTPGVTTEKAADIVAFVSGPESFESFDAILERTTQYNPTRSESSLRRGILHNARGLPDGRWVWRYDRRREGAMANSPDDLATLWTAVSELAAPPVLILGDRSPVVDDADVAELLRRQPDAEMITVAESGHSVQGDQPVALARILSRLLDEISER